MSDTLKCAVIWYTQSWGGVPAAHCTTSYSPELRSVCVIIEMSTVYVREIFKMFRKGPHY